MSDGWETLRESIHEVEKRERSEEHVRLKMDAGEVRTWADGFGVWHARVRDTYAFPMGVAKMAIRIELQDRAPRDTRVPLPHVKVDVREPEHTTYIETEEIR